MGCDYYSVEDKYVIFGEDQGCLCTFPNNDDAMIDKNKGYSPERIFNLALLGATVKLIHEDYFQKEKYICIPKDLPEYLINRIKEQVKLC